VRALDPNCRALTQGLNAEKLIPDIRARIARPSIVMPAKAGTQ
jgi:hypothetical protein